MSTVTFYKTNYNQNNRPFSSEYVAEVYSSSAKTYEVNRPVLPDLPFQLSKSFAEEIVGHGYNYISYEYCGRTYYAFIVAFLPNTPIESYSVTHKTDVWTTFKDTISLSGTVEKGHTNDLKIVEENGVKKVLPDLTNTFMESEYTTPDTHYIKTQKEFISNDRRYKYLYVLLNFGLQTNEESAHRQQVIKYDIPLSKPEATIVPFQLNIACFGIDVETMQILDFLVEDGIEESAIKTLSDLGRIDAEYFYTSYISDLPPNDSVNITLYQDNYYLDVTNNTIKVFNYYLPKNMSLTRTAQIKGFANTEFFNFLNGEIFSYDLYWEDTQPFTYEMVTNPDFTPQAYLERGIIKAHTTIYSPIFVTIGGEAIEVESEHINDDSKLYWCLDPFLTTQFIVAPDTHNRQLSKISFANNIAQLSLPAKLDYFQKLNAEHSTSMAVFSTVKATVKATANALTGENPLEIATQGAVDTMEIVEAGMKADYELRKNDKILTEGYRNTNFPSLCSYGIQGDVPNILLAKNLDIALINYKLHRYGYNTFVVLENYFTEHSRRAFNYVKTSYCICTGETVSICNEIAQMFNKGVTLWKTTPQEYNVTNFQEKL